MTYLKFSVAVAMTGGTTPTWQALGMDFIRSMNLYSSAGSKSIELVSDYASVHTQLRDIYSDSTNTRTTDQIMLNAGVTGLRSAANFANTTVYTYCVPVLSIVGLSLAGDCLLPTCGLTSSLRLEAVLNSAAQALTCAGGLTAVTYQITKPELCLTYVRISELAQAQIQQMTGNQYSFNSTIYRTFKQVHPAAQSTNSILIPATFTSLKSLMVSLKESSTQENAAAYSVSDRIKNQLVSWRVRVGTTYASSKDIDATNNACDSWMSLRRLLGTHLTGESCPTLIDSASWQKQTSATAGTEPGAFLMCQNLSAFSAADKLLCGFNSVGSQIFIELNFDPAQLANVKACNVDATIAADALITIANGEMSIQY
jgi:hypothetical protein